MAQPGTGGTVETKVETEAPAVHLLIRVIGQGDAVKATIKCKPGTAAAVLKLLASHRDAGPGVLEDKDACSIPESDDMLQPDAGPFKYFLFEGAAGGGQEGAGGVGGAGAGMATARGANSLAELRERLARMMDRVDDTVVDGIIDLFAPQLPYADDNRLRDLYDQVEAAPRTSTKAFLKQRHDIVFNGPYGNGLKARATLLIAFVGGTKPLLTKFTFDPDDIKHEHSVLSKLWMEPVPPGIVGPVQLLTFERGNRISFRNNLSLAVRHGMSMPLYPATLQHPPCPMDAAKVLECGRQLKATLSAVHSRGFGHNDVKAANVFLDSEGKCVLGDFGSAQQLGRPVREQTSTHWPVAFESGAPSVHETSQAADFFCLAVTLLERAGAHQLCDGPTPEVLRHAAARLTHAGLRDFIMELLVA